MYRAGGSNLRMVRPSLMSVVKLVNNSRAKRAAKIWTLLFFFFLAVRRRSHSTSASNWDSKAWKFSRTERKSYACALRCISCRILLQQFETTTKMSNTYSISAENSPAMAGAAGPVPAPMMYSTPIASFPGYPYVSKKLNGKGSCW